MSQSAPSEVSWLCPSCDNDPPAGLTEPVCPSCGAKLIEVRTRGEDLTGTVIDGRYEIRALLGEGGMGSVYRAWQRSIGRELAIKLIDRRHSRDPMAVRRFLREARLASQLSQPNTVSVFDFGQSADGRLFIAMELIRGRTLAEVLEMEGKLPVPRAAWIGVQLCDALEAAHRLDIVHRDLKPANVVLLDDPPGRDLIKVLDFGLAKSMTDAETQATDTGLVVGTPRYMAPEIVMGDKPTPASDLYAVGVILGELTTGKVLWDASSFPALAGQKMQSSPVLHEIPESLRPVVAQLITPDRARRPASASEVRGLLRPLVTSTETPVPWTAPQRSIVTADPSAKPGAPTMALRSDEAPTLPESPPPLPAIAKPAPAAEPPRADRRKVALLAGVALAGAIALAVVLWPGDQRPPAPAPAPVSEAPALAIDAGVAIDAAERTAELVDAAPAVTEIVLHVTSRPSGAALTVAGVSAGRTPAEVRVPLGTTAIAVEAERAGKRARTTVVPDRDRAVELVLPRAGAAAGTSRPDLPF